MFTSEDSSQLFSLIDAFQVPMFIADEDADGTGHFTLRAINSVHAAASSFDPIAVRDVALRDLLKPEDCAAVLGNYTACIRSNDVLEYRETLEMNNQTTNWYTTLIPTRSASGRARIVGNAVLVKSKATAAGDRRVFEDINYFSVQSQFQLSRVSSYLDALDRGQHSEVSATDLQVLSALCRTVDRSLQDIRELAEPRSVDTIDSRPGYLVGDADPTQNADSNPVRRTLERLTAVLSPLH